MKTEIVHLANQEFEMIQLKASQKWVTLTRCGHLYDAGLSTRVLDDVTCKKCLRKIR